MNCPRLTQYLAELYRDIYPQPVDPGHTAWAMEVIDRWKSHWDGAKLVLDVGCGEAFLQPVFEGLGMGYRGVCLGEDVTQAQQLGRSVLAMDFHFLRYISGSFDLIFSRHALEHSPMPLLALMEWKRVSRGFLCLVIPNPDFWGRVGQNHYSVLYDDQARFLLERAGWKIVDSQTTEHELRYLCRTEKAWD